MRSPPKSARVVGTANSGPTWPRKLIFDANVFLNLAKTPGNGPILKAITAAVQKGNPYSLVVPEPVAETVHELRDEAIKGHWRIRREALRQMKDYLSDFAPDADSFNRLTDSLHGEIGAHESALPDTIAAMDDLLKAGTIASCKPTHYADAAKRFIAKKAPGHERTNKKRQHIAIFKDCLIWTVVLEVGGDAPLEFVTDDSDFTSPTHNEKLHPDLESEADHLQIRFHTLKDFVRKHISREPIVLPPPPFPAFGGYSQCPVCGSDQIGTDLIPGPSPSGYSYRQFCPTHRGYVDTGEPYDE